jgi:hypothetical protein
MFNEWKNRTTKPQAEYRKMAAKYWKRFSTDAHIRGR